MKKAKILKETCDSDLKYLNKFMELAGQPPVFSEYDNVQIAYDYLEDYIIRAEKYEKTLREIAKIAGEEVCPNPGSQDAECEPCDNKCCWFIAQKALEK